MKKDKTIKEVAKEFHENMQSIADKHGTTISASSTVDGVRGKEKIIAKPVKDLHDMGVGAVITAKEEKEQPIIGGGGDTKFNFTSPLDLACATEDLRPAMQCIHFQNGFAYASDAVIMAKQSLELHSILKPENLEGKAIHKDSFKQIMKFQFAEAREKYIYCKDADREAEFMYSEFSGKAPNFESIIPDSKISGVEYFGINTKKVAIAGKILHGSDQGVRMTFRGGNMVVTLTTEEYNNQLVLIMPVALNGVLF